MIQIIGLMIGLYTSTRLFALATRDGGQGYTKTARIVAAIAGVLIFGLILLLLTTGLETPSL